MTIETTTIREGGFKMSWGAVFAGAIVTVGLWVLLHTLGLAAGLTAIDPQDQGSWRSIGIGAGIWSVLAPLLALFAGGYVAARTAGLVDRTTGAIHGIVVWGLTVLLGAAALALVVSSTVRAGVAAAGGGLGALSAAPEGMDAIGLRSDDLLAPVNQRLKQEGLPPVTTIQLEAATKDVLRRAVMTGDLDRNAIAASLVRNLDMTRAEANQAVQEIGQRFDQQKQQLQQTALKAAERTGKALWAMFFALLLGLVAAAGGAILGSTKRREVVIEEQPSPRVRQVPVETHG